MKMDPIGPKQYVDTSEIWLFKEKITLKFYVP